MRNEEIIAFKAADMHQRAEFNKQEAALKLSERYASVAKESEHREWRKAQEAEAAAHSAKSAFEEAKIRVIQIDLMKAKGEKEFMEAATAAAAATMMADQAAAQRALQEWEVAKIMAPEREQAARAQAEQATANRASCEAELAKAEAQKMEAGAVFQEKATLAAAAEQRRLLQFQLAAEGRKDADDAARRLLVAQREMYEMEMRRDKVARFKHKLATGGLMAIFSEGFKVWVAICALLQLLTTIAALNGTLWFSSIPDGYNVRSGLLAMVLISGLIWCFSMTGIVVVSFQKRKQPELPGNDVEKGQQAQPPDSANKLVEVQLGWWFAYSSAYRRWQQVCLLVLSVFAASPVISGVLIPFLYFWDLLIGCRIDGTIPFLLPGMSSFRLVVAMSYLQAVLQCFPSFVASCVAVIQCNASNAGGITCPPAAHSAAAFLLAMSLLSSLCTFILLIYHGSQKHRLFVFSAA